MAIIIRILVLTLIIIVQYLQCISTTKPLFEEEGGPTTLDSARSHDCNSVSQHIGFLMIMMIMVMMMMTIKQFIASYCDSTY